MTVARKGTDFLLGLNRNPQENSCRPAVDVLFRSVAQTYGANVLAVVLTGMGADGTRASAVIRDAGGEVMVQDEESSVVWGMPGSVVAASLARSHISSERHRAGSFAQGVDAKSGRRGWARVRP